MHDQEMKAKEAIRRVLEQINDHWLHKRYDDIGALLSEHAVI